MDIFETFPHIALRAFAPGFAAGETMPNSCVWVDGECMEDEELPGACGIRVTSEAEIEANLEAFRRMYGWDDRIVYVIGGQSAQAGSDDGEIIIGRAKVLRVIG
jgi:hypothetical protein